jgi:hypothetical protein
MSKDYNYSNPNITVLPVLFEIDTFKNLANVIPTKAEITAAVSAATENSMYETIVATGATPTTILHDFQLGRPCREVLWSATNDCGWQCQTGSFAFENAGDRFTVAEEFSFATGFHDDVAVFAGLATKDTTVLTGTTAGNGAMTATNYVGFHKTMTGTSLAFLVNGTSITVPRVTFAAGTRYFLRATVTKTAASATSATVDIEVRINSRLNNVDTTVITLNREVTTLPATDAKLMYSRAYQNNSTDSVKYFLFGNAFRFSTAN